MPLPSLEGVREVTAQKRLNQRKPKPVINVTKFVGSKKSNVANRLKENVINIRDFLERQNKNQDKIRTKKQQRKKRAESIKKKREKENKLEANKSSSNQKKTEKNLVKSPLGIFDKLFAFGGFLLGGILVNAAQGLIDKGKQFVKDNQELFDTIGNFLSGVKDAVVGLLNSFTGPYAEEGAFDDFAKFSDDGKLQSGALKKVEEAYEGLDGLILKVDKMLGGKQVLAMKDGVEGIKSKRTGIFVPQKFTPEQRKRYAEQGGQVSMPDSDVNINTAGESYPSGAYIGPPGDRDGQQTGLNMNLPGGIGTPIYAPFDMIYKSMGTDGNPSVGLDGTKDALGPSGRGFGYYGAYRYEKNGKEYEVLMGHFRDLPFRGTEGQVIPKGTLLGYQGASGRSVPGPGNPDPVYPHITLHVNGIGFTAKNSELESFANKLLKASPTTKIKSPGEGGGKLKQIKTISQPDPTDEEVATLFIQRVNTIQYIPVSVIT